MLELIGLVRRYGTTVALDGLTFSVPGGQLFGFLGPNGAGKSTAMRAVLHLVALDAGEVRWDGRRYGPAECRGIGYMPEERGLYPTMRVLDQLVYFGRLRGLTRSRAQASARDWLERLGVAGRAGDKVEALSLGNQQRVQLAAALVHDPQLLVLDEPFSGLDPVGVDDLAAVLADQAAAGKIVVFSSHQLDLVEDLCDSVAIVDHGRLVASGTVEELASAGVDRLVVAVGGDGQGQWAAGLPGARVSENDGGRLRLVLDPGVAPSTVLAAATAAGELQHFAVERRRLSEVFREAIAPTQVPVP
ncbi:MAG: ABC transporter ATP-binding protein [Acidimicrobiales bacterium]